MDYHIFEVEIIWQIMGIINMSYRDNHTPGCYHNRLMNILLESNVASKFINA